MNIDTTKKVLRVALNSKITPMVWGRHGIGKSQIVAQLGETMAQEEKLEFTSNPNLFDDKHFGLVDLRLGQMEVGDLIGMPVPLIDEKKTEWLKPLWFPTFENSRGILFLDELNRARLDVLQAVFQLVWDRRLATHILPNGWGIVIACNPSGSDYFVNELDSALMDRFLHIKLTPEVKEWVSWGKNTEKVSIDVTDFIEKYPEMLGHEQIEIPISVKPSPRSWELVSKILPNLPQEMWLEVCSGLVGMESAIPFIESLKKNLEKPIRAEQILNHYKKWQNKIKKYSAKDTARLDLLRMSCDDLTRVLKKVSSDGGKGVTQAQELNIVAFLRDLPSDLSFSVIKYLVSNEQMGTDKFNEILCKYDDLYNKLEKVSELDK